MKNPKKTFCLLMIFCLASLIAGCGGGGGGSSDYTLSPEQLEVATAIEAFASSVRRKNLDQAMQYVFSDLQYPNLTTRGYVQFKSRLENLFSKAEIIEFTISNVGPSMESEDLAVARPSLTLIYTVAGASFTLSENIELYLERDSGKWGIIQFAGYNTTMTTEFPPVL